MTPAVLSAWQVYSILTQVIAAPLFVAVMAALIGNISAVTVGILINRRLARNARKLDQIHAHLTNGKPGNGA
jgi:hypothetical protein